MRPLRCPVSVSRRAKRHISPACLWPEKSFSWETETRSSRLRAWHVVCVLSSPPLTPIQPEISGIAAKAPHSAGPREPASSLNDALSSKGRLPDPESLARKSFFLGNRDAVCRDRFERGRWSEAQAKRLVLARPFGWHVTEAGDANAAWQSAFECCFNQGRR